MAVIGTIVLTAYNNKTYRVDDVMCDEGVNSKFKKKDGSSMTYREYYKKVCCLWIANLSVAPNNFFLRRWTDKKSYGSPCPYGTTGTNRLKEYIAAPLYLFSYIFTV